MRRPRPRAVTIPLALAAAAAIAGCGKSSLRHETGAGPTAAVVPVAAQGAVSVVTKNTTRVGGADPASDAAAVARAAYPGHTAATRPQAVVVVDQRNWAAALAASVLASAPLHAPILFSDGSTLPEVSAQALAAMHPTGAPELGGAQVVLVGTSPSLPGGYSSRSVPVPAGDPAAAAVAVQRLSAAWHGSKARQVILVSSSAPRALQMPAAGLAAESGAPILLAGPTAVPAATAAALAHAGRPAIYLVGYPPVDKRTLAELARYGPVTPIAEGATPGEALGAVANSIAVARYTDGVFGWGVKEPGHGLVFANSTRPLDAPAAALLSATGQYGPLLLLDGPAGVPSQLAIYLADIQPAYGKAPQYQPVHGAYNHGWLIGGEDALSPATQAEIDAMLEIVPAKGASEESSTLTP